MGVAGFCNKQQHSRPSVDLFASRSYWLQDDDRDDLCTTSRRRAISHLKTTDKVKQTRALGASNCHKIPSTMDTTNSSRVPTLFSQQHSHASAEVLELLRIFLLDSLIKYSGKIRAFVHLQREHERRRLKQALAFRLLLALFALTLLISFLQTYGYFVTQARLRLRRLWWTLLNSASYNGAA